MTLLDAKGQPNHEGLLEEFKALREEQMYNFRTRRQLQIFEVVATGAIISAGLAQDEPNPYIFFVPMLFVIPTMFRLVNQGRHMMRIGTYIQCFIEPLCQGIRWESSVHAFRREAHAKATRKSFGRIKRALNDTTILFSWGILFACSFLSRMYWEGSPIPYFVLVGLSIISTLIASIQLSGSHHERIEYLAEWRRISASRDESLAEVVDASWQESSAAGREECEGVQEWMR